MQRTGGKDHLPIFSAVCEVSSIKCTAVASNKKDAKQFAARAVLDAIQNENDSANQPKTLFRLHRKHRANTQSKSADDTLRNRHNYFMCLPEEDRNRAREILLDASEKYGITNKKKIDIVCAALKLQYNIQNMNQSRSNYKVFSLEVDFDCVHMGKIPDLYDRVVDYFKTMLNARAD